MVMEHATGPTAPTNGMSASESRHLKSLEKRISEGLQTFREVGEALIEIRDNRLYRETHGSFELYCADKWGLDRARAYQLMAASTVSVILGKPAHLANEGQARELAPLANENPEAAKQVWAKVEERSEATGKPVTAALIRQVRGEVLSPEDPAPVQTPSMRLVQDMVRLVNSYQRWAELKPKPNIGERNLVKAAIRKLVDALT